MNRLDHVFPNLTKLKLAHDLCEFLDWALDVYGAQLTQLDSGDTLDPSLAVAEFVDIDRAALEGEMLELEEVVRLEKRYHLVN